MCLNALKYLFLAIFSLTIILSDRVFAEDLVWTQIYPSPTKQELMRIIYANGKFISVGKSGTIIKSIDGVSWAACSSGVTSNLNSIAFHKNKFIAVGDGVLSSEDAITWKVSSTETGLNDIDADSNSFVAVGDHKILTSSLTSSDGITWSKQTFNYEFYAIVWDTQKFIAVGDTIWAGDDGYGINTAGRTVTSPDGSHWNNVILYSQNVGNVGFSTINWGNNQYVGAGGAGIYSSQDFIHWENIWNIAGSNITRWIHGQFWFIHNGNMNVSKFYVDDSDWKQTADLTGHFNDVAWGNGCYVAVGQNGAIVTTNEIASVAAHEKTAYWKEKKPLKICIIGNAPYRLDNSNPYFNILGRKLPASIIKKTANGLYVRQQ